MKNIQNDSDFEEIRQRILALSASSPKQWGKMNVQQMLVHCQMQLKLGLGEVPAKIQGPALMRTKLIQWLIFSNLPWPKGAGTPKEMDVLANNYPLGDIESEKNELLTYIEKAKKKGELAPHPLFGKLNQKDWARLIYKHLDHHLKQFGS